MLNSNAPRWGVTAVNIACGFWLLLWLRCAAVRTCTVAQRLKLSSACAAVTAREERRAPAVLHDMCKEVRRRRVGLGRALRAEVIVCMPPRVPDGVLLVRAGALSRVYCRLCASKTSVGGTE
jgi:hypothetical protein